MTKLVLRDDEGKEVVHVYHGDYVGYLPHIFIDFCFEFEGEKRNFLVEAEWVIRVLASLQSDTPHNFDLIHYPSLPEGIRGVYAPCGQQESIVEGLQWRPAEKLTLLIGEKRDPDADELWHTEPLDNFILSRENLLALMQWIIDFKSWDQDEMHHLELSHWVDKQKLRESRERLVRFFDL
jgi:hypothetical protein